MRIGMCAVLSSAPKRFAPPQKPSPTSLIITSNIIKSGISSANTCSASCPFISYQDLKSVY